MIICADCGKEKQSFARGLCCACYQRQYTRPVIICLDCGEEKEHEAKGLCRRCYARQWNPSIVICADCGEEKEHKAKGLCGPCHMRRWRQRNPGYNQRHYQKNKPRINARHRQWRQENPHYMQYYARENPEKFAVAQARRKARKEALPNTLTTGQVERLLAMGRTMYPREELHLDHIVPLSKGGGTTYANMHAIPAGLNRIKHAKLPQEIYEQAGLF